MINALVAFGGVVFGSICTVVFFHGRRFIDIEKKQKEAEEMILKSKEEAIGLSLETKERVERFKKNFLEEAENREQRLKKIEDSLKYREEALGKKEEKNKETQKKMAATEENIKNTQEAIKKTKKETTEALSRKTAKSTDELKESIIEKYKRELKEESAENSAKTEEELKENSTKIAKEFITSVIQKISSPTSVESKTVLIKVPKDHIKGKIVGRGGSNIEEFEKLFDVAVVFNDLPNTISISGHNLVARRIAQKTMEKLVRTPGGIDKNIIIRAKEEAEKEIDQELYEIGKRAVESIGLKKADREFIKTLGRLQYRTSYGQNIMKHSMEVSWIATMFASEIGLNIDVCRVSGFLHDLGKAIDQDAEKKDAHDRLTKELMTKYGFSEEEIHAAWVHHDAEPQKTPEALIIKAADAVSAGRPGARQESIQNYLERIQKLEESAFKFEGVEKVFAISAGREVRVFVDPEKINDRETKSMAKNVAQEIENNVAYPGKIKVNVIRRIEHIEETKVK